MVRQAAELTDPLRADVIPRPVGDGWVGPAIEELALRIREGEHFATAAYRDGEWYCMLGRGGSNINGERYDSELARQLLLTLSHPVGQTCIFWQPHPVKGMAAWKAATAWLQKNRRPVKWLPDCPVRVANVHGLAAPFFRACRERHVVLVGPSHLARLGLFAFEHIVVPPRIAWKQAASIAARTVAVAKPGSVVLLCAGMASNLILWRIWPEIREHTTALDIGSALDPYVGVNSRGAYREAAWQRAMAANLAEA